MDFAAALHLYGLTQADLAYSGSYRGQHFMDNWLTARPGPDGGWQLQSKTWLDGRVLGSPISPQIIDLDLLLDKDGRPLQAVRRIGDKCMTIDFSSGSAVLHDGSRQSVPTAGVQHVLENNHPGLVALLISLSASQVKSTDEMVFLISALTAIPYRLTPNADGTLQSEFGETLRCDDQGRLDQIMAADGAVVITRTDSAPPRPKPINTALNQTPGYLTPPSLASRIEELTIPVGNRGTLAASFTRPAHPDAAGVLVLQGSGDVDRNGFASGIDTGTAAFADSLAEQGMAVLRFDKHGVGRSRRADNNLNGDGFGGVLDDADAALAALRTRIAPGGPVILLGHSLGGLTALALSVTRYAGALPLVLLATPGRPLAKVMRAQTLAQGRRLGLSSDAIARQLDELDHFLAYARGEVSAANTRASALAGRLAKASMADLADLDPCDLMRRQQAAVFMLQGGHDVQVDASVDFVLLQQACAGAQLQAHLLPNLNHLFRPVKEGQGVESYADGHPVDPVALALVIHWCQALASAKKP